MSNYCWADCQVHFGKMPRKTLKTAIYKLVRFLHKEARLEQADAKKDPSHCYFAFNKIKKERRGAYFLTEGNGGYQEEQLEKVHNFLKTLGVKYEFQAVGWCEMDGFYRTQDDEEDGVNGKTN